MNELRPALLMELLAQVPKGPYFVDHHKGTAEDFAAHHNSGLATVDTGREKDWPIAYFCEWPTAHLIARLTPEVMKEVYLTLHNVANQLEAISTMTSGKNMTSEAIKCIYLEASAAEDDVRRIRHILDGRLPV